MIREVGESIGDAVAGTVGRAIGRAQERRSLPADLLESEDAYLVVFDAPGATGEDVQVQFENGTVSVRIDRYRQFFEGYEMRFPGRGLSLQGSVDLPPGATVDATGASATVRENGTLEVELPKVGETGEDPAGEAADADGDAGDEDIES